LEEKIREKGVLIPTIPSIYEPVLSGLKTFDIRFREEGFEC